MKKPVFVEMSIDSYFKLITETANELTRAESKKINECVKRACKDKSSRNATKKRKVGVKHNTNSQEERAQISKYAVENGTTKAARHFIAHAFLICTIFFS